MTSRFLPLILFGLLLASCQTAQKPPQPEREKISSMPHNLPESWEGQAGFGGFPQNY